MSNSFENRLRAPAYPFSRYQVDYAARTADLSHLTEDEERPMDELLARLHTFGDEHALANAFRQAKFTYFKEFGSRYSYILGKTGHLLLVIIDNTR